MTHQMNNVLALDSFKNCLAKKTEYGNDGFRFRSKVIYETKKEIVTEILDVYLIIGGYQPMIKIDIYENGQIITSEKYHLDLNPEFENTTFRFNNKQLIIEGKNSPKIGNYKIILEEHR